jgi:hypothetical protein
LAVKFSTAKDLKIQSNEFNWDLLFLDDALTWIMASKVRMTGNGEWGAYYRNGIRLFQNIIPQFPWKW